MVLRRPGSVPGALPGKVVAIGEMIRGAGPGVVVLVLVNVRKAGVVPGGVGRKSVSQSHHPGVPAGEEEV